MQTFVPTYYAKFSCKAGACRHSCCIGWEIDIDADSLEFYRSVGGDFGGKLRENIISEENTAHFCLGEGERCPFLNSDNLCDIYINLGEDRLCQICADHPRYRNYIGGRCEMGLGMACEAACELILSQTEPTDWVVLDDGEETETDSTDSASSEWETELTAKRAPVIEILQNRTKTVDERVREILSILGEDDVWFGRTVDEWREIYNGLERLDGSWGEMLLRLTEENAEWTDSNDLLWENLLVYFVNRHVTNAADEWDFAARLSFALLSYAVIRTISADGNFHDIAEAARMYSSEVEYSEDNTDALLDELF